jgi:tetratricopeptide (TPR) repeat protein
MGFVLWGTYRNMQKNFSWERMMLFFALTAFSVHALMDLDWQVPALMFWYILLGFVALRNDDADLTAENTDNKPFRYSLTAALVILALASAAGGVHWVLADNAYNNFLAAAGQEPGAPQAAQNRFAVDAAAEKTLKLMPYPHSVYITWGNDAMRRCDWQTALKRYSTAHKMVPRSHAIYKSMGDACRAAGNEAQAVEYYRKADELFPLKKAIYDKRKQEQAPVQP